MLAADVLATTDLVQRCGLPKKAVNQQLYTLEQRGLVRKVVESPPAWAAIR